MNWNPSEKEKKYVELVIAMSSDCLLGRGVVDADCYCLNLIMIAKAIGELIDGDAAGREEGE